MSAPALGVVFDLDGTLVDSAADIAASANYVLEKRGRERLSRAVIETFVGDGAPLLVARAFEMPLEAPELPELVELFLSYYAAHPTDFTTMMPGALEALGALSSLPLGVCTNKPRITTLAVLDGLALGDRFRVVVAGDDLAERKPNPAPVLAAVRGLGLPAAQVLMVGDGPQDILAGRSAGCITVGVRGGIQAPARLLAAEPDHLLQSLAELPALVERLSARA